MLHIEDRGMTVCKMLNIQDIRAHTGHLKASVSTASCQAQAQDLLLWLGPIDFSDIFAAIPFLGPTLKGQ